MYVEWKQVEFYGIKYKKVTNINDYCVLKKEVKGIVAYGDKNQFLIDVENMKNQSIEEKEKSMTINFSLVCSFVFGLISLLSSVLFGNIENVKSFVIAYVIVLVVNAIAIIWLVTRAKNILKLRNDKIIFYETLQKMIMDKEG